MEGCGCQAKPSRAPDLLDGWYASDAAGTVDLAATVAARWVERLVARGTTLRELVAFVDAMNPRREWGRGSSSCLTAQRRGFPGVRI